MRVRSLFFCCTIALGVLSFGDPARSQTPGAPSTTSDVANPKAGAARGREQPKRQDPKEGSQGAVTGKKASLFFAPAALDLGATEPGQIAEQSVTLKNGYASDLRLEVLAPELREFEVARNTCPCCLKPGKTCEVTVRFVPTDAQASLDLLPVRFFPPDDAGKAHVARIPLAARGRDSSPAVHPFLLRFPPQAVLTRSATAALMVSNRTAAPLEIKDLKISGDFLLEPSVMPQTLPAQGTVYLNVRFVPRTKGLRTGQLRIWSGAAQQPVVVRLSGVGSGSKAWRWLDGLPPNSPTAFFLCLLYALGLVTVRWHRIARPTRELLRAQIQSLLAELETLKAQPVTSKEAVEALLNSALCLIAEPKAGKWALFLDVLYWSRGQELTGWAYVHEAELRMVPLREDEAVRARLEVEELVLRKAGDVSSVALANRIHDALTSSSQTVNWVRARALLVEALAANYQRSDGEYADMVGWQNKASWMVTVGLVLILALAVAFPAHAILFLMGAAGGVVSRLSRALLSKETPTDYGQSWTTLFLSPVTGALGGWIGILLSSLLVQLEIVGNAFDVKWDEPGSALALSIAVAFGFSERLLSSVLDAIAEKAVAKKGAAAPVSAPPPPLRITSGPALPPATVGQDYEPFNLMATGVTGTVAWRLAAGSPKPPDGLELKDGVILGNPRVANPEASFVVEAQDQKSTAQQTLKISIAPAS